MCNQRLLRNEKQNSNRQSGGLKAEIVKHLMRQMKRAAAKAKVDEAVTTAKNAIDQATNAGVTLRKQMA